MRRIIISIFLVITALSIGQYLPPPSHAVSFNKTLIPIPTFPPPVSKLTTDFPISRNLPPPEISGKHIFVMDRQSKLVLFSKGADDQIYPASTTKMMTALVASGHYPLDSLITVTRTYPDGVDIGLQPGEKVTVENLLYAMLIQSANDAAEVLAENYCLSSKLSPDGGECGRQKFVEAMNQMAGNLNLHNTHFKNPTGLDEAGHYSSASDLTRLADRLVENLHLRRIVSTENAVIASADFSTLHPVTNVNELLGKVPGVLGIKTGFTDLAGESLVILVNRDGHEVIISLMDSQDRFSEATLLIDWVYSNFIWN